MSHQVEQQDIAANDMVHSNPQRQLLLARESIQELSREVLEGVNGGVEESRTSLYQI